ncbi:MAG: hypothetical protein ABJH45_23025 [Paracoccaceae bacterium]
MRIVHRSAHDDAPIDGNDFELDRKALVVLVFPGRADLVPEQLFAFVDDVPGQKVRCVLGLRSCPTRVSDSELARAGT